MEYKYLDQGDERLLEMAQLPLQDGIAIALHTTGYATQGDEVVELAITDMDGKPLFAKRVKPQNIEDWQASEASGGIAPSDVADLQELYQYEDEIMELVEKASFVVCDHLPFVHALMEASWIALPDYEGFDLNEEFRKSHCTRDYPGEAATAVALSDIARYYGLDDGMGADASAGASDGNTLADSNGEDPAAPSKTVVEQAALIARCYQKLVEEHIQKRDAKGASYWEAYERRLADEAAQNATVDAVAQLREKRLNQMNGLLWISGAIIFTSLVIQLSQRGFDMGFMVVAGAVAVFCLIRGIANFRK